MRKDQASHAFLSTSPSSFTYYHSLPLFSQSSGVFFFLLSSNPPYSTPNLNKFPKLLFLLLPSLFFDSQGPKPIKKKKSTSPQWKNRTNERRSLPYVPTYRFNHFSIYLPTYLLAHRVQTNQLTPRPRPPLLPLKQATGERRNLSQRLKNSRPRPRTPPQVIE